MLFLARDGTTLRLEEDYIKYNNAVENLYRRVQMVLIYDSAQKCPFPKRTISHGKMPV